MTEGKKRCFWCNLKNPVYIKYHDEEWGFPDFSESYLYEMLLLESFQAGLSWECVLNKRDAFRAAFDGFDLAAVCGYGEDKLLELQENKSIIRHKAKLRAAVENSKIFREIQNRFGSFRDYLFSFTGGKIYYETGNTRNALSDAISKDLQARGMKYVGSVIIYAYLQAIGVIYSHEADCFLHKQCADDSFS